MRRYDGNADRRPPGARGQRLLQIGRIRGFELHCRKMTEATSIEQDAALLERIRKLLPEKRDPEGRTP